MRYFYTSTDFQNKTGLGDVIQNNLGTSTHVASNPFTKQSWDNATPVEFAAALTQLGNELTQAGSSFSYLGNSGVRGGVAGSSSTIYADMIGTAAAITKDDAATSNAMADAKLSKELKTAGGFVSLGKAIPSPATVFAVALSELTGTATPYITNLTDGLDGANNNILSDSAKLATIVALTLNTNSGWQFPNQISPDQLQTPLVDGAARSLWLDAIPQVYGIRQFSNGPSNNPGDYGINTSEGCDSLYAGANAATYGAYFTVGSDAKRYDLYVFAENPKASFHDKIVSTLLAQLLTTTGTYDIGDNTQDGLNFPPIVLYGYSNMTYSPFQVPGGVFTPVYCGGS